MDSRFCPAPGARRQSGEPTTPDAFDIAARTAKVTLLAKAIQALYGALAADLQVAGPLGICLADDPAAVGVGRLARVESASATEVQLASRGSGPVRTQHAERRQDRLGRREGSRDMPVLVE